LHPEFVDTHTEHQRVVVADLTLVRGPANFSNFSYN